MSGAALSKHHVSFEPPDVLRVVVRGDVAVSDVRDIVIAMDRTAAGLRSPLALVDVTEMGDVPPGVRAFAARNPPRLPMHGVAIHGASFQTRVLTKLILSAIKLLSPSLVHPFVFVRTEAEARAWLEARRRSLAGGAGA